MSALTELYEQIRTCYKCDIAKLRTNAVPGEGPENAEIMFIGEAPGWNEDKQGRPFCGQAGQFLDQLLAAINLDRKKVYIGNVIKCRPPDNRDPLPTEILNCSMFLDKQLEIIKPKMIVTLGRYSMARFFPGKSISKIHGTAEKKDGVIYFAMYHPAAALHQGNLRHTIEEDMKKIPKILTENNNLKVEKPPQLDEPQVKQLNMFEV
jgi:uracil-DNA glycosylase